MLNLTEEGVYKTLIGYIDEEEKTVIITKLSEDLFVFNVGFEQEKKVNTYNHDRKTIETVLKHFLNQNLLLQCDYIKFMNK